MSDWIPLDRLGDLRGVGQMSLSITSSPSSSWPSPSSSRSMSIVPAIA